MEVMIQEYSMPHVCGAIPGTVTHGRTDRPDLLRSTQYPLPADLRRQARAHTCSPLLSTRGGNPMNRKRILAVLMLLAFGCAALECSGAPLPSIQHTPPV